MFQLSVDKAWSREHTWSMEPVISNVERAILKQLENPDSELVRRVSENNQILLHNFSVETVKKCSCGLLGCLRSFAITLIPNQALYPKFCENHRTRHRRRLFLDRLAHREKASLEMVKVFSPAT